MISISPIFLALRVFRHAIKPFLVSAAAPYGVAGAIIGLWVMHTSFGFMAFLGIASLIGVIVSHVIVLFDFIEEMHARGELLSRLLDAGIIRLRPVMITVGATVLALFPGHPWWPALAATLLRADRWLGCRHVHNTLAGSRTVLYFRSGTEGREMGRIWLR